MVTVTAVADISLKDRILAILSLAAKNGSTNTPSRRFQELFADLTEQFPSLFPTLDFNRADDGYCFSKPLAHALQQLLPFGVDVSYPFCEELVVSADQAQRHLARLKKRYGTKLINELQPAADLLTKKLTI